MGTETCAVCDRATSLADAVHLTIHTKSDAGVVDHYVCRSCYESDIGPLFDSDADAGDPA